MTGGLRTLVRRKGGPVNLARILFHLLWVRVFSALYAPWLRLRGVRIGRGCRFYGPLELMGDPRRLTIGDGCSLHGGVTFWTHDDDAGHGEIALGRRVTCLHRVVFNSWERIEVGDDAAFGNGCYIQDNDHGTEAGIPVMQQPSHGVPIRIGSDAWLGARCIVLKGVTIGDHTVVGAGSVVVRPLPAGVVAVGVPCRPVKRRGGGALPAASAARNAA